MRGLRTLAVAAAVLACARCAAGVRVADVAVWEASGGAVSVAARVEAEGATLSAVAARYTLNFDTTVRNATMSRARRAPPAHASMARIANSDVFMPSVATGAGRRRWRACLPARCCV
jgi:hypothetical protein